MTQEVYATTETGPKYFDYSKPVDLSTATFKIALGDFPPDEPATGDWGTPFGSLDLTNVAMHPVDVGGEIVMLSTVGVAIADWSTRAAGRRWGWVQATIAGNVDVFCFTDESILIIK